MKFRWVAIFVASLALPAAVTGQAKNTCLECHTLLDPPLKVTADQFSQDIHSQKQLTCVSCHGGDASSDDLNRSMSKAAGFRGKIERNKIPALCASCHSNGSYMRQYNPSLRTDQFSQYQTSVHGKRLATGDAKVAVCTDCHGVHNLRPARDSRSQVHPTQIAKTCSGCHSNAETMKGYKIPTDQFASYSASVHHEALTERGDLSAPTCTTCHGNHGASPPGVGSVEFVCSTCHSFQAQLFDGSPHKAPFASMQLPACVTCHSNHRIQHPTDALMGTGAQSVCVTCHSQGDPGFKTADQIHGMIAQLEGAIVKSDQALDLAERSGMEISQAKLDQIEARNALTKARVTIHGFRTTLLEEDTKAGLKIAEKTWQAGQDALAERNFRRKGLGLSLIAIAIMVIALRLYIRQIESA
ncbi:MAG: cytochrome c3 family protein [Acidobacteria bacterium]|nr:cytochrome c3 family protein [Acidobacteriota bacterium]